jgi:hypothetical protein
MNKSIPEIRATVPRIHVFKPHREGEFPGEATVLMPNSIDATYGDSQLTVVSGSGTLKDPFGGPASGQSPHRAIISLWYTFYERTQGKSAAPIFIEVSNWVLQVGPEGVTAADGHFTRLLP